MATGKLLSSLLLISAVAAVPQHAAGAEEPAAPPPGCISTLAISKLAACIDFVTGIDNSAAPGSRCCDDVKAFVRRDPGCVCSMQRNISELAVQYHLNVSRIMMVPSICRSGDPCLAINSTGSNNSSGAPLSSRSTSRKMVSGIIVVGVILMLMLLAYFLLKSWKKKKNSKSQPWSSLIRMCIHARTDKERKDQRGSSTTSPRTGDKPLIMSGPPLSTSTANSSAALRKQFVRQPMTPPRPSMITVFSFEELAAATEGFSKERILGCGGFGYVYHGVLPDGKDVAVKQMKAGSGQGEREFHAEVEIISGVHHRHLVSLVGYCYAQDKRVLVYEFVPNNSLEFHLHGKVGQQQQAMGWSTRLKIALGSAKGLAYLHEDCVPRIIHRDVKAANILLDFSFEAKVADFGLAKSMADDETHVSTRVMGTFGYLEPEYASTGKLTEKSDVFSYGVILLELITGRRAVVQLESYVHESLADWARPLLAEALESKRYDRLVDPRLKLREGEGHCDEMLRLVACAAACVRQSAGKRPRMVQVVRALEGGVLALEESSEACGSEQNWQGFGGSSNISFGSEEEEEEEESSIGIQQKK